VLDHGLSVLGDVEQAKVLASLARAMAGRTMISASRVVPDAVAFDTLLRFEGARAVQDAGNAPMPTPTPAKAERPAQEEAAS